MRFMDVLTGQLHNIFFDADLDKTICTGNILNLLVFCVLGCFLICLTSFCYSHLECRKKKTEPSVETYIDNYKSQSFNDLRQ